MGRRRRFVAWIAIAAVAAFAILSSMNAIDTIAIFPSSFNNDNDNGWNERHGRRSMEEVLMMHNLQNNSSTPTLIDTQRRRQLILDQCPDHVLSPLQKQQQQQQTIQSQEDGQANSFYYASSSSSAAPLFYAASFPGSGDKLITKYLVERLTGLPVGDAAAAAATASGDAAGARGGDGEASATTDHGENKRMVAVRTQFPHTSGQLVSH